jgi:hypothetical protein
MPSAKVLQAFVCCSIYPQATFVFLAGYLMMGLGGGLRLLISRSKAQLFIDFEKAYEVEVDLRPTVSRPVSGTHLRPATKFSFSSKFLFEGC